MDIKHCNDWWNSLTDAQKRWVHYYFWDIKNNISEVIEHKKDKTLVHNKENTHPFSREDIEDQHDFRFTVEHPDDNSKRSNRSNFRKD